MGPTLLPNDFEPPPTGSPPAPGPNPPGTPPGPAAPTNPLAGGVVATFNVGGETFHVSITNPRRSRPSSGFVMNGSVAPVSQGRLLLRVRMQYQEMAEEPVRFKPGLEKVGVMQQPSVLLVKAECAPVLTSGAWTLLRVAPLHGTPYSLVVLVRVTK